MNCCSSRWNSEDLIGDSRFDSKVNRNKNADEINAIVGAWTKNYTKDALKQKLGGKVPFGPVNNAEDIINDPHITARNAIVNVPHPEGKRDWRIVKNPINFSKSPAPPPQAPVQMGANNDEILEEFNVWQLAQKT